MQSKYFINNFLIRLQIPFKKRNWGEGGSFSKAFWKMIKKSFRGVLYYFHSERK